VPPPPADPGDGPDSVHLPRMEPPPPSLEAMVQGGARSFRRQREPKRGSWLVWVAVGFVAVAVAFYVTR
jgi:hypothetical protein